MIGLFLKGLKRPFRHLLLALIPERWREHSSYPSELTKERRIELSKVVSKYAEEARIAVRNIRREVNDTLKRWRKILLSARTNRGNIQKMFRDITDDFIKKIDEVLKVKEKEIIEGD